ncbi:MAG: ATP-dependent Clp protease ATP-binding subunit [Lachnospiraceae bacterium]|nr:ATP-dependent Clp protease ATP-binding subunit [Lachnospiraceae bacterium]
MMYDRFTAKAKHALQIAKNSAQELDHNYVGTEHILLGLLKEGSGTASRILRIHGVTEEKVINLIQQQVAPVSPVHLAERDDYTPKARKVLENAQKEADQFHSGLAGTEHILVAMVKEGECVATRLLNTMGVSVQRLYVDAMITIGADAQRQAQGRMNNGPMGGPNRAAPGQGGPQGQSDTPGLDAFSRDLTQLAREGKLDPVIGRAEEIERTIQILSRRTKNNPCIIGEPGVGKTAIAEGLAQRIADGTVPDTVKDKRLLMLDLSGMVAGSKYRGEFEERIKQVIKEVEEQGDILMFIDEIHTIIGAGGAEGALDASNILKPCLARGEIQVIGATTIDEYRKRIEKDAALERRFQPVTIDEPTEEEAVEMLKGLRHAYEEHHHVIITDEAIESAVKLSARYINDRFLPDKAIDLIDEASAKTRLTVFEVPEHIKKLEEEVDAIELEKEDAIKNEAYEKAAVLKTNQMDRKAALAEAMEQWRIEKEEHRPLIREPEIADVVAMWTKIPVRKLTEGDAERLKNLEATLHERLVGQEEAVTAVSKAIRRGRVGLKDPKRPIGSFMFLGPTGVGKTELSKALAEALFGTENSIIRVDMSEYMEKHSVSKMVGSPPGYVGYEEGGQLSEQIRRNPYSVILFDEIEKAHPDVFNILLQVLDDGHITDAQGRRVDFKNTVIIMTSNAGAEKIVSPKRLGFSSGADPKADYELMKRGVMDTVNKMFKPEFLNRIDEILVFHQLTRENMVDIFHIMIRDISKRTKDQLDISITVEQSAEDYLLDKGYDEKYGARPLRRVLQNEIEDEMADAILSGFVRSGQNVLVSYDGTKLVFTPQETLPVTEPEELTAIEEVSMPLTGVTENVSGVIAEETESPAGTLTDNASTEETQE